MITYEPSVNSWQARASLTDVSGTLVATTGTDGLVYAVESHYGDNIFRVYDPETDTWSTLPSMPTSRFSLSVQSGSDGLIYTIGGTDGFVTDYTIVEAYDPATNTWVCSVGDLAPGCSVSILAPMPTARSSIQGASARGSDGKIYVVGGNTTGSYTDVVEAYDPSSNTWSAIEPLAVARDGRAVAGADGRIYYMGGTGCPGGSCTALDTVEIYDPGTESWTMGSPMPANRAQFAIALGADGLIYAIGGLSNVGDVVVATVDAYNPQTDSWSVAPALPFARSYLAGASDSDGRIYAIGGTLCICNTFETTVQALDTAP
jgi:N-acetylneuraminic acid mutarotase